MGFNKLSNAHQTPDEYPPASSAEGGEGASLIGHDTFANQGGKINNIWLKLGKGNTGWVEPYNWDPARRYVTEGNKQERGFRLIFTPALLVIASLTGQSIPSTTRMVIYVIAAMTP